MKHQIMLKIKHFLNEHIQIQAYFYRNLENVPTFQDLQTLNMSVLCLELLKHLKSTQHLVCNTYNLFLIHNLFTNASCLAALI